MKNLPTLLKSFAKKKDGSVSMMLGLTFTMVTGSVLASIEVEQIHRQRADMQQRLDATLLYLGGSEHKTEPQQPGANFLISSIEQAELNVKDVVPVFEYDNVTGGVSGTVTFKPAGLVSSRILGEKGLSVEAAATPKIQGRVEIAMVLDTSGSMGWSFTQDISTSSPNRRIDGLHEAATEMFDVIYQNPQAVPAVAVIPYSTSVDITDQFAEASRETKSAGFEGFGGTALDDLKLLPSLLGGMPGNLTSNDSILDLTETDVALRDHLGGQAIWAAERFIAQNQDGTYNLSLSKPKSGKEIPVITQNGYPEYCGYNWWGQYVCTGSHYYTFNGINGGSWSSSLNPSNGLLPLTLNGQDVRDYVGALAPTGGTAGHIGAAWGAYALTPGWNSFFNHPAGKPAKFKKTTEKYLVFMTDGVFNSAKDPDMDLDDQYAYFQSVCGKMRDKGVRIFTVGLIISTDDDSETLAAQKQRSYDELAACAGDSGRFFPATNRLELVDAFKGVGRETGELRISH